MDDQSTLRISWKPGDPSQPLIDREWLVTNGMGGYASGTVHGVSARRYHGLFIPNLPSPRGRTVLIPQIEEKITTEKGSVYIGGGERPDGTIACEGGRRLKEFKLEWQMPVWIYEFEGGVIQKRILMPRGQNTVFTEYQLLEGHASILTVRPFFALRGHDEPMSAHKEWPYNVLINQSRHEIHPHAGEPVMRVGLRPDGLFTGKQKDERFFYRTDKSRGLDHEETLFSPGYFSAPLETGKPAVFFASIEPWEALNSPFERVRESENKRLQHLVSTAAPKNAMETRLVLAADSFIVMPGSRTEENMLIAASGEHVRTIIAGYHWFTDWGRDTMISLEGLCLCTGRYDVAKAILRTFANYFQRGLIPNHFPEGANKAIYNTVDATFWYFHALDRYFEYTHDEETLRLIYPLLKQSIDFHLKGTDFGIGVNPDDGLIQQGMEGYALTWMDAKVADWVVTPRRGKPVEIQALWYNALRLMSDWAKKWDAGSADYFAHLAQKVSESFNVKFWNADCGCLFDVVDGEKGNDSRLRPNQIFTMSLRYPVLKEELWSPVLKTVYGKLMTPYGLRTLDPAHPDYKPHYQGDRWARDAAYHQGLVWPWLTGHFMNAWWRLHRDLKPFDLFFETMEKHLEEAGVGSINEIFDADDPHIPRGCIAQAWSVAEILRTLRLREKTMQPA